MAESTNVENNKNNAYIVCMDVKPKEKDKKLAIEVGNYGEKGVEGEYEIKVVSGKVVTSDTQAKRRVEGYTNSLRKMIEKYKGNKSKDDEMSK